MMPHKQIDEVARRILLRRKRLARIDRARPERKPRYGVDELVPDWWPGDGSRGLTLVDLTQEQRDEYDAYQQLEANYKRRTLSLWLAFLLY